MANSTDSIAGLKLKIPDFEFEAYVKESEIDREQTGKSLSLISSGQKDGLANIPGSHANKDEITAAESRLIIFCQDKLDRLAKTTSYALHSRDDALEKLYMRIEEPDFHKIKQECRFTINEIKQLAKNRLVDTRKDEREQYGYLAYFRRSNGITRAAEYPESRLLGIGILLFIVVVETIVNSFFFADASKVGMLGGAMQAALVSVVNVVWSFVLAASAYRFLHHKQAYKKLVGIVGVLIHVAGVLLINLAVAHYRDLIAIDPDTAMQLTLEKMSKGLFHLENLESILLLAIGLVISIVSVWKGYTFDDCYPGYGRLDRRYRQAERRYRDARDDTVIQSNSALTDALSDVDRLLDKQANRVARANSLLSSMTTIDGRFKSAHSGINDSLHSLLTMYREENRATRQESEPAYFSSYFPLLAHSFSLPAVTKHTARLETLNEAINIWTRKAGHTKEELQNSIEKLRGEIDSLIDESRHEAVKLLQEDERDLEKIRSAEIAEYA